MSMNLVLRNSDIRLDQTPSPISYLIFDDNLGGWTAVLNRYELWLRYKYMHGGPWDPAELRENERWVRNHIAQLHEEAWEKGHLEFGVQ